MMSFFVNLFHQPIRFKQNSDDFAVMRNVVKGEGVAFSVFEPLLGGLVAADVEVPCRFWDILKTLLLVDPHAAAFVFGLVNHVAARIVELRVLGWRYILHQMKFAELTADRC